MSWFIGSLWILSCAYSFYLGSLPGVTSSVSTREPASIRNQDENFIGQQVHIKFSSEHLPFLSKVDSGAESSSLHALDIKLTWRIENNRKVAYVNFKTVDEEGRTSHFKRRVSKIDDVKNANGKSVRLYIREKIWLGDLATEVDISLIDRSGMTFKFLLGKNALLRLGLMIDPGKDIISYENDGPRYVFEERIPGQSVIK